MCVPDRQKPHQMWYWNIMDEKSAYVFIYSYLQNTYSCTIYIYISILLFMKKYSNMIKSTCQQQHWEKPFITVSVQRGNYYYPTALSVLIYSLTKWNTTNFLSTSVPTDPQSVMQNVLHSIDLPAFHGFCL